MFDASGRGAVVRLDVASGGGKALATMPQNLSATWLLPTTVFDRDAQLLTQVVQPLAAGSARAGTVLTAPELGALRRNQSSPTHNSGFALLKIDLKTGQSSVLELIAPPFVLDDGLWNNAVLVPGKKQVGALANTSFVEVDITTGAVRVLCPMCAPLKGELPNVPITTREGVGFIRMDAKLDPRTLRPDGRPTLYGLALKSGKIQSNCTMNVNFSYGQTLLAI